MAVTPQQNNVPNHNIKTAQGWPEEYDKELKNSLDSNLIEHTWTSQNKSNPWWPCCRGMETGQRCLAPGRWWQILWVLWIAGGPLCIRLVPACPTYVQLDWELLLGVFKLFKYMLKQQWLSVQNFMGIHAIVGEIFLTTPVWRTDFRVTLLTIASDAYQFSFSRADQSYCSLIKPTQVVWWKFLYFFISQYILQKTNRLQCCFCYNNVQPYKHVKWLVYE